MRVRSKYHFRACTGQFKRLFRLLLALRYGINKGEAEKLETSFLAINPSLKYKETLALLKIVRPPITNACSSEQRLPEAAASINKILSQISLEEVD